MTYNFKLKAEAVWLIVNTVLGTLLVEVIALFAGVSTFPDLTQIGTWLPVLGLSAIRTALGALLAAVTGGGFSANGGGEGPVSG